MPIPPPPAGPDNLPFALGIELACNPADDGTCSRTVSPASSKTSICRGVYELHYVLEGAAELTEVGGAGRPRASIGAGDSLLVPPGASRQIIRCPRYGGSPDSPQAACADSLIASFGALLDGPAGPGATHFGLSSLVLVLPENLRDDPAGASRAAAEAVANWRSGERVGSLPAGVVRHMLGAVAPAEMPMAAPGGPGAGDLVDGVTRAVGSLFTVVPDWLGLGRWVEVGAGPAVAPPGGPAPPPPATRAPLADRASSVRLRKLTELHGYQFPNQTNTLALAFDPLAEDESSRTPFTFGVEKFNAGHQTPPHVHDESHELFFILSGEGVGFCDGERFPVAAGDAVVFRPGTEHGIDVDPGSKMYCLELMLPNDSFAEFVRAGKAMGKIDNEDLCALISLGCGGVPPAGGG